MKIRIFLLVLLFGLLGLMAGVGQVLPPYVPSTGLSVFCPLDGNGVDLSTNGMSATTFGVVATSNRHGEAGKALQLNGAITSYLITPNPSNQLLDAGNGSFSISLWFKTNASGIRTLVNKRQMSGTTNLQGYSLFLDNGKVKFHLADTNQVNTLVNCTTAFNDAEWHHVVAIRDVSAGKVYIYVDNALEYMANDNTLASLTANADLYLGRWINYNTYCFSGVLDDVGIWKRALTISEVGILFRACSDSILQQPVNQSVAPGLAANFFLGYSMANAEYQWQSDNGFGFMNLSDAGQYQGVKASALTISSIHAGNANQLFRCIVRGNGCADTSQTAMLTLDISGVAQYERAVQIKIAPNPTSNGFVYFTTEDLANIQKAEVLSLQGKIIRSLNSDELDSGVIQVNNHAGIYLIRWFLRNGAMLTHRVVVL